MLPFRLAEALPNSLAVMVLQSVGDEPAIKPWERHLLSDIIDFNRDPRPYILSPLDPHFNAHAYERIADRLATSIGTPQ